MKALQSVFPLMLLFLGSCMGNFHEGELHFKNQDYEKAIKEFNKVLFVNLTDTRSLHLRARAFEELEDYDNALADYKKILQFDPGYAQAFAGIGKIAWKLDNIKEAEKYLLLAAGHDMEDFDILLLLGRAMIKNKRYHSAEEFLELAKNVDPKSPAVYYYQGIARAYQGDALGTVTSFNHYIKLDPDNIKGYYNRGFALMSLRFYDWAIEDFNMVLKKDPSHYNAMARRGFCLLKQNSNEACPDIKEAAKNGSKLANSLLDNCN